MTIDPARTDTFTESMETSTQILEHGARMAISDLELMTIRAETLFTYDQRGRMLRSNSPAAQPAPRLFLGRTATGDVIRFSQAVSDALAAELTAIIEGRPATGNLGLPAAIAMMREALERQAPVISETSGPAYRFPESMQRPREVIEVTDANIDVVRDTFPWLVEELHGWAPCFAAVRDGAAVSVCFSSRIGARASEAGVETLPDYRRRGYATAVTLAWGASLIAAGRIPLYSTSWENVGSQAVARRAGLILFGADASLA
jgi:hypothetical protein